MFNLSKVIYQKYRIDLLLGILWIVTVLAIISFRISSFCQLQDSKPPLRQANSSLESLSYGAFSLNPEHLNPQTPKVLESLCVVKGSSLIWGDDDLFLSLGESSSLQHISYHQFTQISAKSTDCSTTCDALSSWSIKPLYIEAEQLIANAIYKNNEAIVIKLPVLKMQSLIQSENGCFINPKALSLLSSAKSLGQDQLLRLSSDSQNLSGFRLLLLSKQVMTTTKEGFIYFNGDEWSKEDKTFSALAKFFDDPSNPYFIVSDRQGILEIKIPLQKEIEKDFNHSTLMPRDLVVYPEKVISCKIGRQRFVLRENDWVSQKGGLSYIFKSRSDVVSLLEGKFLAPLLIIEKIDVQKNKSFVSGKIFSPLRMSVYPFEIEAPVASIRSKQPKRMHKGASKSSI